MVAFANVAFVIATSVVGQPEYLTPSSTQWTENVLDTLLLPQFINFVGSHTTVEGSTSEGDLRAVQSSGGAAGGVVSEGQGYGIMIAGMLAFKMPANNPNRTMVIQRGYEMFLAWKRMCELTTINSCQDEYFCTIDGINYKCLPSWKFQSNLQAEAASCPWAQDSLCTGSAPDGDEDAILGMIFLVLATASDPPTWRTGMTKWALESIRAFLEHQTAIHPVLKASNGEYLRTVKLGSCWGGFYCTNPSYHAPGHYAVFKDFAYAFDHVLPTGIKEEMSKQWESVIETSYLVIADSSCNVTGLVPNWYIPTQYTGSGAGTTGCSGSGTPADEFGAEASRTSWRVAVGWLIAGDERARALSLPLAQHVTEKLESYGNGCSSPTTCAALDLDTGCLVGSVHSEWVHNAFMFAPVSTSLAVPQVSAQAAQQSALDTAASILQAVDVGASYYSGSWVVIGSLTLAGAFAPVAEAFASLTDPSPPPPPSTPLPPHAPPSGPMPRQPPPSPNEPPPPPALPSPPALPAPLCTIETWAECAGSSTEGEACCANDGDTCVFQSEYYSQCQPGPRPPPTPQPSPPTSPPAPSQPNFMIVCEDDCTLTYSYGSADLTQNGVCNDGGPGSESDACELGHDCTDCGNRTQTLPSPPPLSPPPPPTPPPTTPPPSPPPPTPPPPSPPPPTSPPPSPPPPTPPPPTPPPPTPPTPTPPPPMPPSPRPPPPTQPPPLVDNDNILLIAGVVGGSVLLIAGAASTAWFGFGGGKAATATASTVVASTADGSNIPLLSM